MTASLPSEQVVAELGKPAPDFASVDTHGTPVRLSELRGTPVVLVFVPFAFSGTCTGELCTIRDNIELFDDAGVRLLVVSCDATFSLRAWQEREDYNFDLLSDFWPHGEIARAYGVFDDERGLAIRGSFLIDADGVLRWALVNARTLARDLETYRSALALL